MTASDSSIPRDTWRSFELLQSVIDTFPDPIFIKDLQHRWVACNQAFCDLLGQPYDAIIGASDPDFWPADQSAVFWSGDDAVFNSRQPNVNEEDATGADGMIRTIWTRKYPLFNQSGELCGLCGIISDITEMRQRREKIAQLEVSIQEKIDIIEGQSMLLDQLSVPVIQIWESVLLMPLVGAIDSRRASQVLESLLEQIGRAGAEFVLIDITGVPMVDTAVASNLVRAVQAAQLLGCQSVMVGISAEIAQTLVGLGVDFSRITTRATLQLGLEHALERLSYVIQRRT
jgi:rsbT co-antagonist protein RsbR